MNALRLARASAALALALCLVSTVWYGGRWWLQSDQVAPRSWTLGGAGYETAGLNVADSSLARWPRPQAQPRGAGWRYELFTPPEIFYDAGTRSFRVTLPAEEAAEAPVLGSGTTASGLEVLAIEPEPFPLQLVGFVGETGNLLGTFENLHTSETLTLRAGSRVPDLGLTVESVTLVREPVAIPESMTVRERRVRAVVRAEQTGERTVLDQGVMCSSDRLRAQVRFAGEPDSTRMVSPGDEFAHGERLFTVEKIRLAPPEVVVRKEASTSSGTEREILIPIDLAPAN